jgi:hypothetical protein
MIRQIVQQGDRTRLEQTRVLGANAAAAEWATFTTRFGLLYVRLRELEGAGKVVVNDQLDSEMTANTPTSMNPPTATLELSEALVSADSLKLLPARARDVMHELTHAIIENGQFPVKDYGYRNSWNTGYLGAAGADNADSYAEAAGQIAENVFPPGLYGELGPVTKQRQALKTNNCPLGPALAWADIKLNRGWLRSVDWSSFAGNTIGKANWTEREAAWRADPDKSGLLAIEDALQGFNIVAKRSGLLSVGLGENSQKAAPLIQTYFVRLKDRLKGSVLLLTDDTGARIDYDPASETLTVPIGEVQGGTVSPVSLGEAVITALVTKTPMPSAAGAANEMLHRHRRAVVDLFPRCDRPTEKQVVAGMQTAWNVPFQEPRPGEWKATAVGVNTGYVLGLADNVAVTIQFAMKAAEKKPDDPNLSSLHQEIAKTADKAIAVKDRWPDVLNQNQTLQRKTAFGVLRTYVAGLSRLIERYPPATKAPYDVIVARLDPYC